MYGKDAALVTDPAIAIALPRLHFTVLTKAETLAFPTYKKPEKDDPKGTRHMRAMSAFGPSKHLIKLTERDISTLIKPNDPSLEIKHISARILSTESVASMKGGYLRLL